MASYDFNSFVHNFINQHKSNIMKFTSRSYMKPTPANLRHLGDGLLGVSATITAAAISAGNDTLAYIALGIGVLGKFLTNFFEDNE